MSIEDEAGQSRGSRPCSLDLNDEFALLEKIPARGTPRSTEAEARPLTVSLVPERDSALVLSRKLRLSDSVLRLNQRNNSKEEI